MDEKVTERETATATAVPIPVDVKIGVNDMSTARVSDSNIFICENLPFEDVALSVQWSCRIDGRPAQPTRSNRHCSTLLSQPRDSVGARRTTRQRDIGLAMKRQGGRA